MSDPEESPDRQPRATAAPQPDTHFATVYGPADLGALDLTAAVGEPGAYPFTRGIYREMYQRRLWTMRQYAGFSDAAT